MNWKTFRKIELFGMKLEVVIAWKMRIFMLIAAAILYYYGEYRFAGFAVIAFLLSLGPVVLKRSWHANLPPIIDFGLVLLLAGYTSMISIFSFEALTIPHYDKLVHIVRGGFVGLLLFSALFILMYHTNKLKMDYRLVFIFVFFTSLAIGTIVEITELIWYSSATEPQLNTLLNIIADGLGGLIIAALGVWYLKITPLAEKKREFNIPNLTKAVSKTL